LALCTGQAPTGEALWTISVHDVELPGLWVVIDREFRPAQ
jgi:hypothetical protein